MDLLTRLVESSLPSREVRETGMPKMAKFESDDDIEAYLTTFERMMRAYNVAEESWPFRLDPEPDWQGAAGICSLGRRGGQGLSEGEGGDIAPI